MSRTSHRIERARCFFCDQEKIVIRTTSTFKICLECIDWYRSDLVEAEEKQRAEQMDNW